jgi:hypothetical protein
MDTFEILLVIAALLVGAGVLIGAAIQDRIMEDRRRRLSQHRRQVNETIRLIRMRRHSRFVDVAVGEAPDCIRQTQPGVDDTMAPLIGRR